MASISLPTVLAIVGTAAAVGTAVVSYEGAQQQAEATRRAATFNQEVAQQNATIAAQQAQMATATGAAQVQQQGLQTRAVIGAIKSAQAASNISVDQGSAVDVRSSAAELGQLDALTLRSNAARTAYGYEVEGTNFTSQAQLDEMEAQSAIQAGQIGEAGSILGGASSASGVYRQWQMYSANVNNLNAQGGQGGNVAGLVINQG